MSEKTLQINTEFFKLNRKKKSNTKKKFKNETKY